MGWSLSERAYDRMLIFLGALGVAAVLFMQFTQGRVFATPVIERTVVVPQASLSPAPVVWPSSVGASKPTHLVAVTVLSSTIVPGTRREQILTVDPAAEARMWEALQSAADVITRWSDGKVRVRFEIHLYQQAVRLIVADPDHDWRWPDPDALPAAPRKADMRLVLWSDPTGVSGANLAGSVLDAGGMRPYLSIPVGRWLDSEPGEAIVHEFCHGLAQLAPSDQPRADLHDAARYGFTADADGSWGEWYARYLQSKTKQDLEAAVAAIGGSR